MAKKFGGIVIVILVLMAFDSYTAKLKKSDSVIEVLEQLGHDFSSKKPKTSIKGVSAFVGEDIVKNGFSNRDGQKKARRQSKHFVCTSCHNIKREDPDLRVADSQARLLYTSEQGLPYLQATTLYGAVNRKSFYNGDYDKKYGDLVKPARNNIREAIQLCARECAQGRELKDWEIESILAYLWKIDLKFEDLSISDEELNSVSLALNDDASKSDAIRLIESKYLDYSPATFIPPPSDRKMGNGLVGVPENGKLIYENSCLHCHYQKRYSFLNLDNNKMSFNHLNSKAGGYNSHSIYQVVRYGTYSKYGKRSYMPQYTEEKMSEQQLADLRAYIQQKAKS